MEAVRCSSRAALAAGSVSRPDPADPPSEFGHVRPRRRIGENPQPEGECRRADVVPALDRDPERDRVQVGAGELPVTARSKAARRSRAMALANGREQAERLAVAKHSRGNAQLFRCFGDTHKLNLTNSCQE